MLNAIKTIKNFLNLSEYKKEIAILRADIKRTTSLLNQAREDAKSPKKVIENLFSNGLEWNDYDDMSNEYKSIYFNEAQAILNGQVLDNEINRLTAEWSKEALIHPKEGDNRFEYASWLIAGMTLYKERLEEIIDPNVKVDLDFDPNENI